MTTEPAGDRVEERIIGVYVEERVLVLESDEPSSKRGAFKISGAVLAWAVLGALFLALRLGPTWQAPVGGAEWLHLSGAWQARAGEPDGRFVPSLFQALSTLILHISASEIGPRIAAFIASASIPAAVWMLRSKLGEAGALASLLLVALDAPAIAFGASASAMGFDLPIALWLLVLVTRDRPVRPWLVAAAAFAAVTAGPIPLPLIAAWATLALARGARPPAAQWGPLAIGAAAGVLAASLRFGLGFDGLRIPAIDLFAASFEEQWASSSAFELTMLYSPPLLVAAFGAAIGIVVSARKGEHVPPVAVLLLGWFAFALSWLLSSAGEHTPAPLAAVTLPAALLAGPALVRAFGAMWRAEWRLARYLVPAAAAFLLFAIAIIVHWGQVDAVGGAQDRVMTGLLLGGAGVAALAVALERRAAPALLALGLGVSIFPVLAGAFGVALSAGAEPIPSPVSPPQARELRDLALARAKAGGGTIVIHPSLEADATWPVRESGEITVASRAPADAAIVVWPADLPAPEGMVRVSGAWSFARAHRAPDGFLRYVKWYTHRNAAVSTSVPAAVYVGTGQ
ncbi:MAG: hypothetical protein IT302_13515 [Dehalococcoidia bacterium]|nr:hypothetical protein [Dehalococcoidia bacterium]